jgi:hypothetical protein
LRLAPLAAVAALPEVQVRMQVQTEQGCPRYTRVS